MAIAFLAHGVLGTASALAAGRTGPRRVLSLALALGTIGAPFLIPAQHTLLRALLALGVVLVIVRAVDLARDPRPVSVPTRVGLMFAVLDLRAIRRAPVRLEPSRLLLALACASASIGAFAAALAPAVAPVLPLRWLLGAAGVCLSAEAANALALFSWHAAGYRIPKQHDAPVLSQSITELWSRRWNVNVRDWLHRNCHLPLARRGHALAGVIAAFVASALLHYWFIAVALGARWGLVMASFFLLQGAFVLAETRLRPRTWGRPMRRFWTVAVVLGSSPLFVEPFLRLLQP